MLPGLNELIKSPEGGKDHIVMNARTIYHGVRYRIEFEEDLLKLFGHALMLIPGPTLPGGTTPAEPPPAGPHPFMPPSGPHSDNPGE